VALNNAGRYQHNAPLSGAQVEIHYPWSPFYGKTLDFVKLIKKKRTRYYLCVKSDGQRVLIPEWMTDPIYCFRFSSGSPLCSLDALVKLRNFLHKQHAKLTSPQHQESLDEDKTENNGTSPPTANTLTFQEPESSGFGESIGQDVSANRGKETSRGGK
jgi:hypothetical protein